MDSPPDTVRRVDLHQPLGVFLAGLDWERGRAQPVPVGPVPEQVFTAAEFFAKLPWSGQTEPAFAPSGLPTLLALATNTAVAAARRSRYLPRPSWSDHMRPDVEAAKADIEQSVGLLRRRL